MPAYTPVPERLFSIGWAKQPGGLRVDPGGAVAPTNYWRWLDGSEANPDAKFVEEREGDMIPEIGLFYKSSQMWKIVIKERIRPITFGCALQAHYGTGSDAYTAPSKSTTLNTAIAVGANTFVSNADLGNVGNAYVNFTPGVLKTNYEVKQVNLASRTGASAPYTYTLVAGQTFRFGHLANDAITTASTHVFTRQLYTYDFYSIEVTFGESPLLAQTFRLRNCTCWDLELMLDKGKALEASHTWYGMLDSIPAAPTFTSSSLVLEGNGLVGTPGAPFKYDMAAGNWQLDGAATGNALTLTKIQVQSKNTGNPDDMMSENIYPDTFVLGEHDLNVKATAKFNSWAQYNETYFGTTTPSATAVDAAGSSYGSIATTFTLDGVNSLALNLPQLGYKSAPLKPRRQGNGFAQDMDLRPVRSPAFPNTSVITLTNSQAAAY